jgi:hypothetical protein
MCEHVIWDDLDEDRKQVVSALIQTIQSESWARAQKSRHWDLAIHSGRMQRMTWVCDSALVELGLKEPHDHLYCIPKPDDTLGVESIPVTPWAEQPIEQREFLIAALRQYFQDFCDTIKANPDLTAYATRMHSVLGALDAAAQKLGFTIPGYLRVAMDILESHIADFDPANTCSTGEEE